MRSSRTSLCSQIYAVQSLSMGSYQRTTSFRTFCIIRDGGGHYDPAMISSYLTLNSHLCIIHALYPVSNTLHAQGVHSSRKSSASGSSNIPNHKLSINSARTDACNLVRLAIIRTDTQDRVLVHGRQLCIAAAPYSRKALGGRLTTHIRIAERVESRTV